MIIDQALDTYGSIHTLMLEIEQLLKGDKIDELIDKHRQVLQLQEHAKSQDKDILSLLQGGRHSNDPRITELLDCMQQIQELNRRITPQVHGIMAVQREELKKLRTGNTMMRGYHSNTANTGSRLSHSG